jgi:large subunit ribosomal protein L25
MEQVVFSARKRDDLGSGKSGRIRAAGRIPAVIYGKAGKAVSIDLDYLEFGKGIRSISESTIVKVSIDGADHQAFVKSTQRNILNGKILHVDFYEVEKNTLVRTKVSIHIVGTAAGTREGGIMESPLHELEVECLPQNLPERIDVDVSELKANQSIHVRDLKLGDSIRVISNPDQVIALVKYAKAEVVDTEVAVAAPEAPAAAAAAAAAPAAPKA